MAFDLDPNYKQVPERIADFKEKHPEGRLRPADLARPFWFEQVGEKCFLVYVAAAYQSPEDPLPGIGCAWEPFPGTTPYTRNSELQNAETSAWGRAIVASLASESKTIASAEDVRNRKGDSEATGVNPGGRTTTRPAPRRETFNPATGEVTDDPAAMNLQQVTSALEALKLPLTGNLEQKRLRLAEHRTGAVEVKLMDDAGGEPFA